VDVSYARDATYRQDIVERELRAELGALFSLRTRRLGGREYASRIEGRLQNVTGVLWCKVTALGRFPAGVTNPETLILPLSPRPVSVVMPCGAHELLQVTDAHFTLNAVAEPSAGECA
jgi:hypothetical protein